MLQPATAFCQDASVSSKALSGLPEKNIKATGREKNADSSDAYTLEAIKVKDSVETPATGKSEIKEDIIKSFPKGNGSLNEILRILPDVQLSDTYRSSNTGGEIMPPEISISGGRTYENNYTIDGFNNNSLLDPSEKNPNLIEDVPGHSQEIFLDADLVDNVTVFDSNIPAEYGGFTGGVVDAATISPREHFSGRVSFRTTRSDWTEFHVDEEKRYQFENSNSQSYQPEFEKYSAGADLNIPLNETSGIVSSYRIIQSKIPLDYLDGTKNQYRKSENFFLKYGNDVSVDNSIEITLLHAPYKGDYFTRNAMNSDFTLKGGGTSLNAGWNMFTDSGELSVKAGYRRSENSRDAQAHWKNWLNSPSKNWGNLTGSDFSSEGGFGSIDKTQDSFLLKSDFSFAGHETGLLRHRIKTGFSFENVHGEYERKETTYVYKGAAYEDRTILNADPEDSINGEQFFRKRNVYEEESADADLNQFGLYLQDLMEVGNLKLFPGLRLTYDDFMENLNPAPRFSASWDIFADTDTVITGGLNRYYSSPLITYKLREAKKPFRSEYRSVDTSATGYPLLTDWTPASGSGTSMAEYSKLKTPYSDEAAIGLDQAALGGRLSVKYVYRKGKDEYAKGYGEVQDDGLRYYTLNNNGSSEHHSYRVSWQRQWPDHLFMLNATWQETETSNDDYDDIFSDDDTAGRVWYDGEIIYKSELPKNDYNRPVIARLTWIAYLPGNFTFTNFTEYRSGYENLEKTGDLKDIPDSDGMLNQSKDPVTGEYLNEQLYVYEKVKRSSSVVFDWKIKWEKEFRNARSLELNLEINNVFDEKVETGASSSTFEMGRQFWAGIQYSF